jgi:hypothetical protein
MASSLAAFPIVVKFKCLLTYTPATPGLLPGSLFNFVYHPSQALCPVVTPSHHRHVPRAPLPKTGVTCFGMTSCIMSEGTTLPSSLIRAHASDQNPPASFSLSLVSWSLQVAAGPCWELALPGFISAILTWLLGPLPRSVSPVHLPVSSRRTSASR